MKQLLSNAIAFAVDKHKNQFDKAGQPYILHPLKVMHYLKTNDHELMAIAVLHDVIEDHFKGRHEDGYQELINIGMTPRVIAGVRALTKIKDQTLEVYIAGIKANIDAILVKLCDLRHNMDPRRMKGITEEDRIRNDKYSKMYWEFTEFLKTKMGY